MKSIYLSKALIKLSEEDQDAYLDRFINFLKKKNLLHLLKKILTHLETASKRQKEETTFKLSMSHQLSEKTVEQIKKIMEVPSDTLEETKIEPNLVAGFVGRYNNTTYDASLQSQLRKLKNILNK